MSTQTVQLCTALEFIGGLWLHEIDSETLANLNGGPIRSAYEDLGGFVPVTSDLKTVEELAVDFCQLLIGPKNQVSPVQSVWEDRQFQGDSVDSIREFFKLLPNYHPRSNLVDHLGVELDFVGKLMLALDGDSRRDQIVRQFYCQHLRWCTPFLERVKLQARTDFYRGLATVTGELLDSIEEKT